MKRQLKLDQVQGIGNKEQKAHSFLQKEMGDCKDLPLDEELNPGDAGVNFHASPELDYYEPDALNQPDDTPEAFHVQDHEGFECRYSGSHFPSNNKLYNHLCGVCQETSSSSVAEEEEHESFDFSKMFPKSV